MNILSLSMLNRSGLGKSSDLIEWEFKLKIYLGAIEVRLTWIRNVESERETDFVDSRFERTDGTGQTDGRSA